MKEAYEEASIPATLSHKVRPAGSISYVCFFTIDEKACLLTIRSSIDFQLNVFFV